MRWSKVCKPRPLSDNFLSVGPGWQKSGTWILIPFPAFILISYATSSRSETGIGLHDPKVRHLCSGITIPWTTIKWRIQKIINRETFCAHPLSMALTYTIFPEQALLWPIPNKIQLCRPQKCVALLLGREHFPRSNLDIMRIILIL